MATCDCSEYRMSAIFKAAALAAGATAVESELATGGGAEGAANEVAAKLPSISPTIGFQRMCPPVFSIRPASA